MGELDVRLLLHLLRGDQGPDPMAERLMEMYQEWVRRTSSVSRESLPNIPKPSGKPPN